MIDAGKAAAICTIFFFVVVILWGKTARGQEALKSAFGDKQPKKPQPRKKRSTTPSTRGAAKNKPASKPTTNKTPK